MSNQNKPRTHYSARFFLKQAFTSLWRNGVMSVASIAVLMSCLVVLGCFALLIVNINVNLENIAKLNEIMVFCDTSLEESQVKVIEKKINAFEYVESCKRITKEEALQNLKDASPDYADIYDDAEFSGENNPLCESFEVIYKGTDETEVYNLESELRNIDGVAKINSVYQTAKTIDKFKSGTMLVSLWFLAILFLVSIFVIINTIKLAVQARAQEIAVMRYVGATRNFITTPFVFEGIIIGVISSVFAFAIDTVIYINLSTQALSEIQIIELVGYGDLMWFLLFGSVLVGVVTGIIGSLASLKKNLQA